MSKFLDRLDRITRGPVRTLGFGPAAPRETIPTLALLAGLTKPTIAATKKVMDSGVDAIIFGEALEQKSIARFPKGTVWGVAVSGLDKEKADKFRSQGCDFMVFDVEHTLVEALEEGDCGRVLRVPSDLEEAKLRGIEDLPADLIVVNQPVPDGRLNLTHLLAIANVRNATNRYLILEWNSELSQNELEQLRTLGIDGLLVTGNDTGSIIGALRKEIDALPNRKPRGDREQRGAAILPRLETAGVNRSRPEPDEDDDDDWEEP